MNSEQVPLAALGLLLLAGAWLDITKRQLPNVLCMAILLTGILSALLAGMLEELPWRGAHFLIALLAGMLLFRLGMIGGGDAKFYVSTAIWFPLSMAPQLLLSVSLSGVLLVIIWISSRQIGRRLGWAKAGFRSDGVPYGVAIAIGAIATKLL